MARFLTIFLLLSIVAISTLKAEEHHENKTVVGEDSKKDLHHKEVGHEEQGGVAGKEQSHGKEKEEIKHDEHVGKKEEQHVGGKEGEAVKKEDHHGGGTGGAGVKTGEQHGGGTEGAGDKAGEHHTEINQTQRTPYTHERQRYADTNERQRSRMQQPYRARYEPRGNRTRPWSSLGPEEQEEKVKLARMNNVIINGVPEKENEDMRETVVEIGHKLGFEYPLDDVDTAYRLVCTKEPRPIIIRLVDMHIKAQWIIAYRRSRLWKEQLYMEEHLTKNTQKLCHSARLWANERGYPHVWTWHGDVFYRQRDNPLRFKILNMDHLQKLQEDERANEVSDRPPAPRY